MDTCEELGAIVCFFFGLCIVLARMIRSVNSIVTLRLVHSQVVASAKRFIAVVQAAKSTRPIARSLCHCELYGFLSAIDNM